MNKIIEWECLKFFDLKNIDLYQILALRQKVFIIEQKCIYQDLDNFDQGSLHLRGLIGNHLVSYARVIPPGLKYTDRASIGRVVIDPEFRLFGIGKALVKHATQVVAENYGTIPIHISAQAHLARKFYECLGFKAEGANYDEDGIPHIGMDYVPLAVNEVSDFIQRLAR